MGTENMLWGLRHIDKDVLFFLNHLGPDSTLRNVIIRILATGAMYALVVILAYLSLKKPDGGRILVAALGSAALAVAVGKVINQIVARDRPFAVFPEAIRHVSLIVRPDSFPSIHAAAALGLASAVLLSRHRLWGAVMLMFALLMAAARVAAGVHWPSDLAGGGLIGLAAAVIIARLHHRCWRRPGLVKENDARRSVV